MKREIKNNKRQWSKFDSITSTLKVCFLKLQKKCIYYSAIVASSYASSFVFCARFWDIYVYDLCCHSQIQWGWQYFLCGAKNIEKWHSEYFLIIRHQKWFRLFPCLSFGACWQKTHHQSHLINILTGRYNREHFWYLSIGMWLKKTFYDSCSCWINNVIYQHSYQSHNNNDSCITSFVFTWN